MYIGERNRINVGIQQAAAEVARLKSEGKDADVNAIASKYGVGNYSGNVSRASQPAKTSYSTNAPVSIGGRLYQAGSPEAKAAIKYESGEELNAGEIIRLSRATGIKEGLLARSVTGDVISPAKTTERLTVTQPTTQKFTLTPTLVKKRANVIEQAKAQIGPTRAKAETLQKVTPQEIKRATALETVNLAEIPVKKEKKSFFQTLAMRPQGIEIRNGQQVIIRDGKAIPLYAQPVAIGRGGAGLISKIPKAERAIATTEKALAKLPPLARAIWRNPFGRVGTIETGIALAGKPVSKAGVRLTGKERVDKIVKNKQYDKITGEAFKALQEHTARQGVISSLGYGLNPAFANKEAKQVYIQKFIEEGKKAGISDEEALRLTANKQLVSSSFVEGTGLAAIATTTEFVAEKAIGNLFGRSSKKALTSGKRFSLPLAKKVFPSLAGFGAIEGGSSILAQQQTRFDTKTKLQKGKEVAFGSVVGAGSAGILGGLIVGTAPVSKKTSNILLGGAYLTDPLEFVGDITSGKLLTPLAKKSGKKITVPTISVTKDITYSLSQTKKTAKGDITISKEKTSPIQITIGSETTGKAKKPKATISETLSGKKAKVPTIITTPSITPSITPSLQPTTPTTIPTNEPVPIPETPVPVPTITTTPTTTNIFGGDTISPTTTPTVTNTFTFTGTPIPTPTPIFRIPPPVPLAFPVGIGGGTSRRKNKIYLNELAIGQRVLSKLLTGKAKGTPIITKNLLKQSKQLKQKKADLDVLKSINKSLKKANKSTKDTEKARKKALKDFDKKRKKFLKSLPTNFFFKR